PSGTSGTNGPARSEAPATPAIAGSGPTTSNAPRLLVATLAVQLPTALSRGVAFAEGTSLLLAGGLTKAGTTAAILRITVPDGPIEVAGRLSVPVHDAGGAELGG